MKSLFTLSLLILISSCSSLTKMAIRSQAPLFEKGSASLNEERDWQWFKEATPGNIQMMETLLSQDPDNQVLRRTLIKAYSGYAYAVFETEGLREQYSDAENKISQERAIKLYRRSLVHGEFYFSSLNVNFSSQDENKILKQLKDKTSDEDLPALVFFAQAWGASINLQKQDMILLSQLPKVKLIFDFVCKKKPDIENGVCPLFYAQYETSRPKMLGGNPELGRQLFVKFIKENPSHLLARINYIQFSVIPRLEEEEFLQLAQDIEVQFQRWIESTGDKNLNLYNAIALERWNIMKSFQKKLF
ncbi:MAG: TRAP transporter TatT component family protein [Bacteriovoracaceae bacterium]|nr:TRAP transporter TatT component family protein [Bacteriovoracaceae bacterium]